jgi:hypothetical protein
MKGIKEEREYKMCTRKKLFLVTFLNAVSGTAEFLLFEMNGTDVASNCRKNSGNTVFSALLSVYVKTQRYTRLHIEKC